MTNDSLETAIGKLTDIQRDAVRWDRGPLLVLAGPGSGKTQVLTCRIASLLDGSREKSFRVLALTFTNKAADEMRTRVTTFVPGLEDRANIATFHGFCAQVLRQHGVHIGINPDFAIYSSDDDRRAILEDALRRAQGEGQSLAPEDVKYLSAIDRMKAKLIDPTVAESAAARLDNPARVAAVYLLYESELRRLNALDYNSLISEAYRLVTTYPTIGTRYQRSHPYWLIDEFQDTNSAQYRFIRALGTNTFRSLVAVADDDQIIYGWNGASYKQIQSYLTDFAAELIQLPTNYRCPAAIVEAANRLVVYNAQRTSSKKALIAGKTELKYPVSEHIQLKVFDTDDAEAAGIAVDVLARGHEQWGQIAILARTRALLDRVQLALQASGVRSTIAQRRDEFLSPEFKWLVAALHQIARPLDLRNLSVLISAFNRLCGLAVSVRQIVVDAETTGRGYLMTWANAARLDGSNPLTATLLDLLDPLLADNTTVRSVVLSLVEEFEDRAVNDSDLAEDLRAWRGLNRDIEAQIGRTAALDEFLQQLQMRSKEPAAKPDTVTLMTIHGAKGQEYDVVYVIGLAEDVMPSFQSKQKGGHSPEMEEERRNCFVAITRTKECLVLSRAESYRNWRKAPSRFLVEMGLAVST